MGVGERLGGQILGTVVLWKERAIRSGEEINYEEVSDPDPCNFKVMKCPGLEHELMPAAHKEYMVMNQPDWSASLFVCLFSLQTQDKWY